MPVLPAPMTLANFAISRSYNVTFSFIDGFDMLAGESLIPWLYNIRRDSKREFEEESVTAGLGLFSEWQDGQPLQYDSAQDVYKVRYNQRTWQLGLQWTRNTLRYDPKGIAKMFTRDGEALAKAARYTREVTAMELFNTNPVIYSVGNADYHLFDTEQYVLEGTPYPNTTAVALPLSISNLEFAVTFWQESLLNLRGQLLNTRPSRMMVSVRYSLLAERLVTTIKGRPQSNENDRNVIPSILTDVRDAPLMANDGRWCILGPRDKTGLRLYVTEEPNTETLPMGDNASMRMSAFFSEEYGATHPQNIVGFGFD